MPVAHIGLTVSHLPTSTSFFLSALQPLGYRYIGQSADQVGLGIRDADFFLCQETPGVKAGAAHIAFTAPSTTAVRNFYAAALTAGGRPNGPPASRSDEDGHFNAAVLDFDGNSIEVVYRNKPDIQSDGTVIEHSRVITWQRNVAESSREDRSLVYSRTSVSRSSLTETIAKATSLVQSAPSVHPRANGIARSVSEPVVVQQTKQTSDSGDAAAKTIIGTLLGAAAGAAVAYAMVQSEKDSTRRDNDFNALMQAKNTVKVAVDFISQVTAQPVTTVPDPQPQFDTTASTSPPRSVYAQRQIEPAPSVYYSATSSSKAPSQIGETQVIEYVPAPSVAPSQAHSRYTTQRSVTSPEFLTVEKARSVASTAKPRDVAQSVAPSSFISSFVPDVKRRSSEGSVVSHRSSRSKSGSSSSSSHVSKHSSRSHHSSRHGDEADLSSSPPTPASLSPPKTPSKAGSIVGSILGRYNKSTASNHGDFIEDLDIEELTEDDFDFETVVPGDSVSCAGSRRKHRSHRSKKNEDGSVVSKHSSSSKHSKHSHRSHRSHKSRSHDHSDESSWESEKRESEKRKYKARASVVSESSDASTVKPTKSSSKVRSRKDSVTRGQYDDLFEQIRSGRGSVAAMPVREITPSMVSAAGKNQNRVMVNYNMAQKARVFET